MMMHGIPLKYSPEQFLADAREIFDAQRYPAISRGEDYAKAPYLGLEYNVFDVERVMELEYTLACGLVAQKCVRETGPSGVPLLPLDIHGCLELTDDENPRVVLFGYYGISLCGDWRDFPLYPSFHDHSCGIMASPHAPDYLKNDAALLAEFPPRLLEGLDRGLGWTPLETVCKELAAITQIIIRDRQRWRECGMPPYADRVKAANEQIAELRALYPSKFQVSHTGL